MQQTWMRVLAFCIVLSGQAMSGERQERKRWRWSRIPLIVGGVILICLAAVIGQWTAYATAPAFIQSNGYILAFTLFPLGLFLIGLGLTLNR